MNRQLTLASQHGDLEKGDLIAVAESGGTLSVGVFSQVTKKGVLRYIEVSKDLDKVYAGSLFDQLTNKFVPTYVSATYEKRWQVECSRRPGVYRTGYSESRKFDGSSIVPYHVDLLTEEQKVNYQKIRQFLRCSDDN